MSLCGVSDAFLARRAAWGDDAAFGELVCRYRRLVLSVCRRPPLGGDGDVARQEALLGLFKACVRYDPARGSFSGFAQLCVHSALRRAGARALAPRHLMLTNAVRDGDQPTDQLSERVPAGPGSDPAIAVALRDELRERREHAHARRRDRRRRYSDEQVNKALVLNAQGKTIKQIAHAVGAPPDRVRDWLKRAGQPRLGGRRHYTPGEIERVLSLLQDGASLRQAGATVGASTATVLRWAGKAAA